MDERIGTIGNTQGVNASSMPSSRNTPAVFSHPPPPMKSASRVSPASSKLSNVPPPCGADAVPAASA
ncbi:Uncharacterised protein [Bordetella pertussis]|nr:Uncharacterised protein [Bordetella pertussis]CFN92840.1 Uncharacterised protein [Bordetella pertussis]CFO32577.1 Uncharacterised protein [Bordetella pertussis]CFO93295.1 Uncharacterised protein [Bordetella pertussis]CFO97895.1 Uncharacterised protein [Bordetella pertussis]